MGKLIFNYEKCTGCRACELACSFHKEGVFAPSKSRIKIVRIDEEGLDIPIGCEQCDNAPCITACPTRALSRNSETNAIVLNPDFCIGCKQCMVICPFGAIHFSTDGDIISCDLCGGDPVCVKYCQARPENSSAFMANPRASALQFVEPTEATLTKRMMQVRKLEHSN